MVTMKAPRAVSAGPVTDESEIKLLVSVRNSAEARIAIEQGVDILDVKEPANGSLGGADARTIAEILSIASQNLVVSIALGELIELNVNQIQHFLKTADQREQIKFVKIGLSQMSANDDWQTIWRTAIQQLPSYVQPVAVAYIDRHHARSPDAVSIFKIGDELGCPTALMDTFSKSRGNFLNYTNVAEMTRLRQCANGLGMNVVLAGSIEIGLLAAVQEIHPQFVGVRGAVCDAHDRNGGLCEIALTEFKSHLAAAADLDK